MTKKKEPRPLTEIDKNVLGHPKIKAWLDDCRAINTKHAYSYQIRWFFNFINRDVDNFLSLSQSEKKHLMLQFSTHARFKDQPLKNNTINGVFGAVNSFLETQEMRVSLKGKRPQTDFDLESHDFSHVDLQKMFEVANTKEKALLALACSTGWEISALLSLKRVKLEEYVERAKSEDAKFFYFLDKREKTGVHRLGILNPLCLEWLEKWLIESKTKAPRKRRIRRVTAYRPLSDVFDEEEEGANKMLKKLAKEAHIVTIGRIHFHRLRAWVMGQLSASGFNEWETKFIVGKKIPSADMTYLWKQLQHAIEQKYPSAYESHLNLQMPFKAVVELNKNLEKKDQEMKLLQAKLSEMELQIKNLEIEKTFNKTREFKGLSQDDLPILLKLIEEQRKLMKTHTLRGN